MHWQVWRGSLHTRSISFCPACSSGHRESKRSAPRGTRRSASAAPPFGSGLPNKNRAQERAGFFFGASTESTPSALGADHSRALRVCAPERSLRDHKGDQAMEASNCHSNRQLINTIAHGDCIEIMRQMPANSVDFILTDPPYL